MHFFSCFYQFLNQKISHFKKKRYHSLQELKLKIEKFSKNAKEIRKKNHKFSIFELKLKEVIFELKGKGQEPTRAETPSARASSAWTHH